MSASARRIRYSAAAADDDNGLYSHRLRDDEQSAPQSQLLFHLQKQDASR